MKITKAIVTAAGYGSRFLPFTKNIQKEMLPVVDRPLIDYVVDDCIQAGVEEIIFVVNKRTENQIKEYYSENKDLYNYLVRMHKQDRYLAVEDLHIKAKFTYVHQPESGEYGTAVPLKLVKDHVKNEEAFLMFMGDDFIYNSDGSSEARRMIKEFEDSGADALMSTITVPEQLISKYGIVKYQERNGRRFLSSIIEKPKKEEAPSNLANISKFIFKPAIFDYLEKQLVDEMHNELLLTDTVLAMSKEKKVLVYTPKGKYLDCGYPAGWLEANIILAKDREDTRGEVLRVLSELK